MQWALSEKVFEEMLLTDEWSRMSDADIDTFLDTPGIEMVEAKVTEQNSHVNGPNDLMPAQGTSPEVEDIMEISGINEEVIPGDLEGDSFDFFEKVESDNEFIIHSDTINYEDSIYDRVYSCFSDDSFFLKNKGFALEEIGFR